MNKNEISKFIQDYINDNSNLDIIMSEDINELERFYFRTALRLKRSYDLYRTDKKFMGDFLMSLRDYLLVFDTGISLDCVEIPEGNPYAIRKDLSTGEYYCSFQFPNGVIDGFAESAFMRGVTVENNSSEVYNLITDSLIYKMTGYTQFKSIAQKLAVYGALNTPSGYTTMVSLPTGGGKSLITQMLAFQNEGLTIVVVPTVSLADDQLISAKKIIKSNNIEQEVFTYRSGVEIAPILSAIQNRTARLLFISPEALMNNQAFEHVLRTANKQHYIRNIVIDEAHIVVDWGASFRVDYQCLEAWRKQLMYTNPSIRTVLLSATYETKTISTIKKLFSDDGKWIEVRCDALRHEPRYIYIGEKSISRKNKKAIELVRKLPHPMIIYVSRPDDAERVKVLLADNGILNVFTYTGLTNKEQREKLLKSWKADEFEIMVATSAFGVGVDKPDVRTVLHLYVPQNPNAYYQELGRGGRDQLPCLSVMCTCPEDMNSAFQRISKRVMTSEKIARRWDSMFNNKASIRSGDIVHINTAIKPNYATKDEWDDTPTSDTDMNWNIYVLLLFRRYDLIEILSIVNDSGVYIFTIKILSYLLLNQVDEQLTMINQIRTNEWEYYYKSYKAMEKAIESCNEVCWSQMFFDTYDKVDEHCAGCLVHTQVNNSDKRSKPLKKSIKNPMKVIQSDQRAFFEDQDELVIIAPVEKYIKVINHLDSLRLSCLVASQSLLEELGYFEKVVNLKNTYIVGYNKDMNLLKGENYYYFSGVVAVIYPSVEKEAIEIFNLVQRYLCNKPGISVAHIFSKNIYIPGINKSITDLINGRVITVDQLR